MSPAAIDIRRATIPDVVAIESLYTDAFPEENLLPLIRALSADQDATLEFVATTGSEIIGHIAFTACNVAGRNAALYLLGPLAVSPGWQRRGVGSALVRSGLRHLQEAGAEAVFVLGDPAFYSRFGFRPDHRVSPPYELPAEWQDAWQSLGPGSESGGLAGELRLPAPWLEPSLWGA